MYVKTSRAMSSFDARGSTNTRTAEVSARAATKDAEDEHDDLERRAVRAGTR